MTVSARFRVKTVPATSITCLLNSDRQCIVIRLSDIDTLFYISIWTSFVSSCLFLVGTMYAVSSVSVSAATRLAYDMYGDTYYTYADLTFNFCLKYMICFSYCVYRLSCVFFL